MAAESRKRRGLAARIVRVTLLIGTLTVLTTGGVALVGASRLAVQQVEARDRASLQVVQEQIVGRLSTIESLATRVSQEVASERTVGQLDKELAPIVSASSSYVDQVIVTDRTGRVITAFPSFLETGTPVNRLILRGAVAGETGFKRVANGDGTWSLWLLRTVVTPTGASGVLFLRADYRFLGGVLDNAAGSPERVVAVLESGKPLLTSHSSDQPLLNEANWRPVSSGAGQVRALSAHERPMVGYYTDIRGIEGIDWRLAVLEPSSQMQTDTIQAVAPTILVLLIGALVAVASAVLVSQRLVRPLRMLEATAYRAANGSFVQPIPAGSDDEIGQVANAFNAVALRLNALHDLSQLLAGASQLEQVFDGILSAMRHIVGPGVAAIYLLDDDGQWLVPARARGADVADAGEVAVGDDGWLAQALRKTEVEVHSSDLATLQENMPGLVTDQAVALTAPLVSGHEALGCDRRASPGERTGERSGA